METSKPILQLDSYFFQGHYEDMVGTAMMFKEDGELIYQSRLNWSLCSIQENAYSTC